MGKVIKSTVPSLSENFNYNQILPGSWSPENVEEACNVWSLDDKDRDKLKCLQQNLSDLPYWKNEPHHVLWFMKGPLGFSSPKAVERHIRKMVDWRIENDIDGMLHRYEPHPVLLQNTVSAMLNDLDRDGDPIYVERGGAMDPTRILKQVSKQDMIDHAIWIRELHMRGPWAEEFVRKNGHPPRNITIIYDMEGLGSGHINPRVLDVFKEVVRITKEYYSAPVKKMIIIRAPALFRIAWSMVKHIFPAAARKKMVFTTSSNYLDVLDEYVDIDLLPPCINPNGHGRSAPGMPRLIGEEPLEYEHLKGVDPTETASETSTTSLRDFSRSSTIMEDEDDLDDGSTRSTLSVTGQRIAYGYYWEEPQEAGILENHHVPAVKAKF